jgi:hypothetical protein
MLSDENDSEILKKVDSTMSWWQSTFQEQHDEDVHHK